MLAPRWRNKWNERGTLHQILDQKSEKCALLLNDRLHDFKSEHFLMPVSISSLDIDTSVFDV